MDFISRDLASDFIYKLTTRGVRNSTEQDVLDALRRYVLLCDKDKKQREAISHGAKISDEDRVNFRYDFNAQCVIVALNRRGRRA